MEGDREFKHLCKLCNRSFPCGRSLGGHMRSHLIESQAETGENLKKMKLVDKFLGAGVSDGYSLRKNPKKTCRLAEFSAEDRFCRECGKSFQSWKALFGHMKCHSIETERVSSNLEFEGHSDDDHGNRSRRKTRYMAAETDSSSVSDHNDQEQEEVALCLMMLSRDVGGFYSTTAESLLPKTHFPKVVQAIPSVCMGSKMVKLKEFHSRMDSGYLKFERTTSEFSAYIVKMNKNNEKYGSSSNNQTELNPPQFMSSRFNSDQRKLQELSNGELSKPTPTVYEMENQQEPEIHMGYEKKNRKHHQCSICFRIFSSGQALGGHKRSHLISGSEPRNKMPQQTTPIRKPEPELRDYLDLNLPAPIDEEGSSNHLSTIEPWWVGGSQSHEPPLVGLI
ncbi:Zinc finger protein ZAT9, partial [Cucurbita argyrosperma subsp. argyrosperma]